MAVVVPWPDTESMNNTHTHNFSTPEACWDSESRQSPFSTVADIEDEFCEDCEAADGDHCDECERYLRSHGVLS
jgi:hypothetical protein